MAPIRGMLAASGVTEQQWRILRVLAEHGPLDASTVAERSSLLFPSLTRTANAMRKRGLISQVQDQTDRRRQLLDITPEGQQVIDDNLKEAVEIAERYKEHLGTARYADLLALLRVLAASDATQRQ